MNIESIYLDKMKEVIDRLSAAQFYLNEYKRKILHHEFDSSILQVRKSLECIALAAIAPNRNKYKAFREKSEANKDYRKDFNGSKILKSLERINNEFYPIPLLPRTKILTEPSGRNHWHYEKKEAGFLTRKNFESIYDRLGKYLHADNPWGNDKSTKNLETDIPETIEKIYTLLELHKVTIIADSFRSVWVVEVQKNGNYPSLIQACAI